MQNLLDRAVADLQEKYSPQVIILYGSRARGDATPASDIDIVCFACLAAGAKSIADAREFDGLYLDAWIYPIEAMSATNDELLRVADGYCLYDTDGQGAAFLMQLRQRIAQGRSRLSAAEIDHMKRWVEKMLERSSGADVESCYRRYWLAIDLLQIYFDLRGQWYWGPKKSLNWLKAHDAIGYQLFSKVYLQGICIDDLHELAVYVIQAIDRVEGE